MMPCIQAHLIEPENDGDRDADCRQSARSRSDAASGFHNICGEISGTGAEAERSSSARLRPVRLAL